MTVAGSWTGPEGQRADRPFHVAPLGDKREHVTNGDPCPCMPRTRRGPKPSKLVGDDEDDGEVIGAACSDVIVHNAYDAREVGEVGRRALYILGSALAAHGHTWTAEERDVWEHLDAILEMHWPANDVERASWPKPDRTGW